MADDSNNISAQVQQAEQSAQQAMEHAQVANVAAQQATQHVSKLEDILKGVSEVIPVIERLTAIEQFLRSQFSHFPTR